MLILALALTGLAALVHVFIFYLESLAWTGPLARRTFGTGSEQDAAPLAELAFNQGFYNLFLAIQVLVGIGLHLGGQETVGTTLVLAGAGSMVTASLVLLVSSPDKRGAALKQGAAPALGVIALVASLVA